MSIRAENLSKKYLIGRYNAAAHGSLRETLASAVSGLHPGIRKQPATSEFWALKDLSFDIPSGQIVGIIGRNGAGKSTLLKVLSRITQPTTGMFEYAGRMASLLEVGTGFHPDLTGRENIFLNGAILGMSQNEIRRKFDEIVAFSEVEQFLETPVKRYSSGMYMRLAFAIAAHLDPEIMIIDEVLAVGDAAFQKKCLGRMGTMAESGRTVLFVSHNTSAVRALCDRVIVLEEGSIVEDTTDVGRGIGRYAQTAQSSFSWTRAPEDIPADAQLIFSKLDLTLEGDEPNHRLIVRAELSSRARHLPVHIAFDVLDSSVTPVMQAIPDPGPFIQYSSTPIILETEIDLPPLIPGTYRVSAWVGPHNTVTYDWVQGMLEFRIETSPDSRRSFPHHPDHGFIVPMSRVRKAAAIELAPSA